MTLSDDDYKSLFPARAVLEDGAPVAQPLSDHCKIWRSRYEARRRHGHLTAEQRAAVDRLMSYGEERIQRANGRLDFETGDDATETALNDIQQQPHIFVLGCVMDRRIKASRAWCIPVEVGKELGSLNFSSFAAASEGSIKVLFKARSFHRTPEIMADCFYRAIRHIEENWDGDASQIWSKGPSAATVHSALSGIPRGRREDRQYGSHHPCERVSDSDVGLRQYRHRTGCAREKVL